MALRGEVATPGAKMPKCVRESSAVLRPVWPATNRACRPSARSLLGRLAEASSVSREPRLWRHTLAVTMSGWRPTMSGPHAFKHTHKTVTSSRCPLCVRASQRWAVGPQVGAELLGPGTIADHWLSG